MDLFIKKIFIKFFNINFNSKITKLGNILVQLEFQSYNYKLVC